MVLLTHSLEEKPAARIRGDTEVLGSLEKHLALANSSFNFKSHVTAPFWSGYHVGCFFMSALHRRVIWEKVSSTETMAIADWPVGHFLD